MKSQQEFDHLVRQHLLKAESPVGEWDVPADHVWDDVKRRIQDKPRRGVFWWLFFGAFVLPLLIVLFILAQKTLGQEVETDKNLQFNSQEENITSHNAAALEKSIGTPEFKEDGSISELELNTEQVADIPGGKAAPVQRHQKTAFAAEVTNPRISVQESAMHTDGTVMPGISSDDNSRGSEHLAHGPAISQVQRANASAGIAFLSPMTIVPLTAQTMLPHPNSFAITARSVPRTWSLTAAFTPSIGTRRIAVPNAQPRVRRDLLLQQEDPAAQLGFAVSAIRAIGSHWSVGFGIEYSRFLLHGTSAHQIRYTRAGETLNSRGNFENRFALNLNTSYGDLSTDVIVERASDAQLEENQFINLSLQTKQSMQVLQFPVSARYDIPLGHLKMSMQGGVSANVLLENSIEFRAVQSLNTDIVRTRVLRHAQLSGSRNFTVGYHFGVGFEMPLDRKWSILMEPLFSGFLQPVYRTRHVVIYPIMVDVHLGVRYRL